MIHMNPTKQPNAIEIKHEMNCGTCKISDRCRHFQDVAEPSKSICKHYTNPLKGAFNEKANLKAVK